MSPAFEAGMAVALRAIHSVPWAQDAEREPHEHEYRIEVTVQGSQLDDRGVVVDLDVLEAAITGVVNRLQGQVLDEMIAPQDAQAVTVEILARWIHAELADRVRGAGANALSVRVWESPDAFGGYRAALG
jgi:6-pyruvoyltetrahydropterin/6-carboxytetrahydropterin synthase